MVERVDDQNDHGYVDKGQTNPESDGKKFGRLVMRFLMALDWL
jgi:hypothetical protein